MKVILFSKNTKKYEARLKDYNFAYESNYEKLKERINNYEGLIAFGLGSDIALSNIKWIQSLGAGVDWAVNNKSLNKDVVITRITEGLNQEVYEYVLARILSYYQNIVTYYENQQKSLWERSISESIVNKNVLIIGTGVIGSYIGKELNNLKINVYGINSRGYDIEGFKKCFTFETLDLSMKYDVVVNILPSTKETTDIFNKDFFNKVNLDVFINVGRGTAVHVDDLINAVNNKKIKMAYLDVFKKEPLSRDSKLWSTPNIMITPHSATLLNLDQQIEAINNNYHKVINNQRVESVSLKKGY